METLARLQIFLLAGGDPSGTLKNVFWRKHTAQRALQRERRVNEDIKYLKVFSQHSLHHKSDLVSGDGCGDSRSSGTATTRTNREYTGSVGRAWPRTWDTLPRKSGVYSVGSDEAKDEQWVASRGDWGETA